MNADINSIITPDKEPSIYNSNTIKIFSFVFLLFLNNTIIAVPLPVSNPLISADIFIELFKYSSVNITLAPQFGIKPIKLVMNGPKIVFFRNSCDRKSSPIYVKIILIIKFITNINNEILSVCLSDDFSIPCSQSQFSSSHIS